MCMEKKKKVSLAVTHLRESPRCFRVKRVRSAFCFPFLGFLNPKHLITNNTHMLKSFEVFSGRNHFLGFLCRDHLINCPGCLLYDKSVSLLINIYFIDREHAVADKMTPKQRTWGLVA